MRGMFGAFELLEQARLRKEQRIESLLSLPLIGRRRRILSIRFAEFGILDLIGD